MISQGGGQQGTMYVGGSGFSLTLKVIGTSEVDLTWTYPSKSQIESVLGKPGLGNYLSLLRLILQRSTTANSMPNPGKQIYYSDGKMPFDPNWTVLKMWTPTTTSWPTSFRDFNKPSSTVNYRLCLVLYITNVPRP